MPIAASVRGREGKLDEAHTLLGGAGGGRQPCASETNDRSDWPSFRLWRWLVRSRPRTASSPYSCPRRTPSSVGPCRACGRLAYGASAHPLRFPRRARRFLSPARHTARLVRALSKVAGTIPDTADASLTPEPPSRHLDAVGRSIVPRLPAPTVCPWPPVTPSSTKHTPLRTGPPSPFAALRSSSGRLRRPAPPCLAALQPIQPTTQGGLR